MERRKLTIELTPEEIALIDAIYFQILAFQADYASIASGEIVPSRLAARQLARTHRLNFKAVANESYKLCLDLGLIPGDAGSALSPLPQHGPVR